MASEGMRQAGRLLQSFTAMLRRCLKGRKGEKQEYDLFWVTDRLATGPAPMSYDHLDFLKASGVDAIMNLCAEYCDLHQIESGQGFEVFHLPVEDEETPQMQALDAALDWLDECIYLGKKVYVHCHYGIGRTGTVISAYLLRRGLGSRTVNKKLKKMRSRPSNYSQWQLVRAIGKREGALTIREPVLEWKQPVDLSSFFAEYEALLASIASHADMTRPPCCGDPAGCCGQSAEVTLIEAAYLLHQINRGLHSAERQAVIARSGAARMAVAQSSGHAAADDARQYEERKIPCALCGTQGCLVSCARPLCCRLPQATPLQEAYRRQAREISCRLFFALTGSLLQQENVSFPLSDVASGKFIQTFFHLLSRPGDTERAPDNEE